MQYQKYATRLNYIIQKIKEEKTGSPDDLARKFGISKRMVFNYINYLRDDLEKEIEYCQHLKTYKFKNNLDG